jgi:hypothetical protein
MGESKQEAEPQGTAAADHVTSPDFAMGVKIQSVGGKLEPA